MQGRHRSSVHLPIVWLPYLWLLIVLIPAAALRLYGLGGRSFWLDELQVARAADAGNWRVALQRLSATPPAFGLTLYVLTNLLGKSELVLRFFPFMTGVASIPIVYVLGRRFGDATTGMIAAIVLAFSRSMVHQSRELKPYTVDVIFAISLVLLTERLKGNLVDRSRWVCFVSMAALALLFSYASIFTLSVAAVVQLLTLVKEGRKAGFSLFALSYLTLAVLFCSLYWLVIRNQIRPDIVAYWTACYPDACSFSLFLQWFLDRTVGILRYLWDYPVIISAFLSIAGLVSFWRQRKWVIIFYTLMSPLMVLLAAFLHRYPYCGSRLILFLGPTSGICLAEGIRVLITWALGRKHRLVGGTLMVALAAFPVTHSIHEPLEPGPLEETRPLIEYLRDNSRPDDHILVYYGAIHAMRYYFEDDFDNVFTTGNHRGDSESYLEEIEAAAKGTGRLWVIFSHVYDHEDRVFLSWLDEIGHIIDVRKSPGAALYLYRVSFSPRCGVSISFDSAFYDIEAHSDRWWYWMRDDGQVSLESPWTHNAKADVNFTGWSLARERTLQIFQNGELLAELIVPVEPAEFSLPDVTLKPGSNTFTFNTYPGAELIDSVLHNGDSRDVSIALSDVTLNRCRYTKLPSTAQPLEADFGGRVKLLGCETSPEDGGIAPLGRLGVTLYWQSLAEMDKDYTIFVHLVDQAGHIYSQQDCQPQEGDYPTSLWRRGEVVWDAHELSIPPDTPAGSYRLVMGMYLLETMERLPVVDQEGERLQDDMIPLGEIQIK